MAVQGKQWGRCRGGHSFCASHRSVALPAGKLRIKLGMESSVEPGREPGMDGSGTDGINSCEL